MAGTAFLGGDLGYRLLRRLGAGAVREDAHGDAGVYKGDSKLERLFGRRIWAEVAGKVVVDFGCGGGQEAIDLARQGARHVIGIDIRQWLLDQAAAAAERAGVAERCTFTARTDQQADLIVSLDGFEHFDDPAGALEQMRGMLREDGRVLACFGPTWYHPYGGHLFSVFPWAHLIFTEHALIRWRSDFKSDGATRFREVDGGLNLMTIARFERLLAASPFHAESLEAVPIRRARWLHGPLTREFLSSVVRCRLAPKR
jgi:SAM-dependent methyltransferase